PIAQPLPEGYRPLASLPSLGDASISDATLSRRAGAAMPRPTQAAAWQTTGAFARARAGSGRHR
ncbi:hypothetical protein, partial [Rhizobium laguerreae]|uniref:hypothetical protein n=1 Tax=Rhizobium laguerreae TaxID=1076926 RepID=UPI00197CC69E